MKLTDRDWAGDRVGSWFGGRLRAARVVLVCLVAAAALGQAPSTTTVTGTVYLANGQPGAGTLVLSWPTFTTAAGQLVVADSTTVTIPADGFVSVNLVANQGSTPAGEYYTAVYYMSDGSTHTQYWVVPAAASATLAAVQSQVMPAAQAVQAVSKAYVDQAIAELAGSEITSSGGSLTGPLYLNGDPTVPLQAADKHYVDTAFSQALPLSGGTLTGALTVDGATQSAGAITVRNNADAEVDYNLWPGLTASQKGSFTYKDWNGNSQWSLLKDAANNWSLNSAVGGLDSFKAYQSTNSGDTYIDASNSSGHIRLNYESGSGAETDIYAGSSSSLVAAFLGTASIRFPGLAASSGTNCLQVDNAGNLSNTGAACGSGGGSGSGTVGGQTPNYVPLATAPAALTAPSHFSDTGSATASGLNFSAPGLQDTLVRLPYYTWSCGGGAADEGTATANCITTDMGSSVLGRQYAPSENDTAITWVENPFAPLSVSSGQPPEKGSFSLILPSNLTITTNAEVDLGFDSLLDCGNGYPGGGGPGSAGTFIQPEATGYPTTTLIGLGSLASNATAVAVQGSKLKNCGLSNNGLAGMTAVDVSQVQEGAQALNNRIFGFQICFNGDANATDGGNFHFWGLFNNQCEISDSTDSTVWGARYGYNKQGGEVGLIENFSAIGGANTTGNTRIGVENDSSGMYLRNLTEESLTYGVLSNAVHSSGKSSNTYDHIGCSSANAASSICGWDDNAGEDYDSIWMHIAGPNTNFLQSNEPSAAVRALHGDPVLGFYAYAGGANTGNATVLTDSPQVANSNLKFGDSYSNNAAWPVQDLPAKTIAMTISGNTFLGTQYMTASDVSGGVVPEGLATNGDLQQQTSLTPHAMALTRHGPGNCIFVDSSVAANDWAVPSSTVWNGTSAVACHDFGSTTPPTTGVYIGKIGKTVSSAPSAPAAPTVGTNCTTGCTTTYTYELVQMANNDPLDHTQSAGSSGTSVSSAAVLDSSVYNTITAPSACTSSAPCELFETAGPHTGWLQELISTTSIKDNGIIGTPAGPGHGSPLTVGIIDPPVHVEIGSSGASLATSSAPRAVQPDNSTITVNGSGVISTAAGSIVPYYINSQGNSAGAPFANTANSQYGQPYPVYAQTQFNRMCVYVNTDDTGGGLYGLALVKLASPTCTGSGCATTTEAHWQGQTLSATGAFCAANVEGSVTVTPGMYYMVTTGSATTAKWAETNSSATQFTPLSSASAGTSSSGVFGTITLSVASSGLSVLSGTGGPIWAGLSQ
jgi:hypothetical protein